MKILPLYEIPELKTAEESKIEGLKIDLKTN